LDDKGKESAKKSISGSLSGKVLHIVRSELKSAKKQKKSRLQVDKPTAVEKHIHNLYRLN